MNPWFAKAVIVVGSIAMIVIPRTQHGQRNREIKVVKSLKGPLEHTLLALVSLGFLFPLIWVATPVFAFANYPLRSAAFIVGILCLTAGLWFLYRSHNQLGTNWSITLEVWEYHRLMTEGIYRRIRHPMYLALLLYCGPSARASQLGRRPVLRCGVRASLGLSHPRRGADDARGIREGL